MNKFKFNYEEIAKTCVKCGKCKPACTIFGINKDETSSPRGFIDLINSTQNGKLDLDKNAKKIFESCFLCTNCVNVCPNNVPTDEMIENIRYDLAQKYGIAWWKRFFFYLLRRRTFMDFAAKLGYVFQSCGFKVENKEMKPRFSFPMVKKERLFPTAKKKSFLNSHPEFIDYKGDKTIGIFIGCMGNYAYTDIGEGLLKICKALKINAHLMKDQACCAAPAYFTGDFDTVEANAKKNIAYFEKLLKEENLDAIIIPEATCSAMIKVDYPKFFHYDKEWQERAIKISEKIYIASEYFAKHTNLISYLSKFKNSKTKLTYHDPCHAKKMQGVFDEPREILSQIYELNELSDHDSCCGFGGVTMQSENYHLSRAVGLKRASQIIAIKPQVVSAECSACKMQLNNSLHVSNSNLRCENWVELVAKVL